MPCVYTHPLTYSPCPFTDAELQSWENADFCQWHLPAAAKLQWEVERVYQFAADLHQQLQHWQGHQQPTPFAGVVFPCAYFNHCQLYHADFRNAHFMGEAHFQAVRFYGRAHFDGAVFAHTALFDGSYASVSLSFDDALFLGEASFDGSSLHAGPLQIKAVQKFCEGRRVEHSWRRARFFDQATFFGRVFNGPVDFRHALFHVAPEIAGCAMGADIDFPPRQNFLDLYSRHALRAYQILQTAARELRWGQSQVEFAALVSQCQRIRDSYPVSEYQRSGALYVSRYAQQLRIKGQSAHTVYPEHAVATDCAPTDNKEP